METVKKVWQWVVWSSENSEKISLTVKAGIPAAILALGIFGYDVPEQLFSGILASVMDVIMKLAALGASLVTLYGAIRKVLNSLEK